MPIEIRELIIRASVESERIKEPEPSNVSDDLGFRRQDELKALQKMIEQKNER